MNIDIKCIVWDLDNTIWHGTLLENDTLKLKGNIEHILAKLDARGILHSIASRNDPSSALAKLDEYGLTQWFLYPQISWGAKSKAVERIGKRLNISLDTILFIDDQEFELEEVHSAHPEVLCINSECMPDLLNHERLNPQYITESSGRRRLMYLEDMQRSQAEEHFEGPNNAFLASLNMNFIISKATSHDLKRAHELTVRTNQLNSTGITYSMKELEHFLVDESYTLLVAELTDNFGSYGKIGLALVHKSDEGWYIKLLLMSCRVISRGVGSVFLTYIMKQAQENGQTLYAEFKGTDRNRMMYITYCLAGFREYQSADDGVVIFKSTSDVTGTFPEYLHIQYPAM